MFKWSQGKTIQMTVIASLAHCLSTILLGLILALTGSLMGENIETFTTYIAPGVLVLLGIWFIIRHSRHKHFHLHLDESLAFASEKKIMFTILGTMFLSPCLEIEALFVTAGTSGWNMAALVASVYLVVTTVGMVIWMYLALKGLQRINSHKIEHNAGLISGAVLIATGVASFFLH